jgi:hypothetical protein
MLQLSLLSSLVLHYFLPPKYASLEPIAAGGHRQQGGCRKHAWLGQAQLLGRHVPFPAEAAVYGHR